MYRTIRLCRGCGLVFDKPDNLPISRYLSEQQILELKRQGYELNSSICRTCMERFYGQEITLEVYGAKV